MLNCLFVGIGGDTLNAFLELVLEDPEKNTKEYLLSKVRESL